MKRYNQFLAFCFFHANALETTAFSVPVPKGPYAATTLRSSSPGKKSDAEKKVQEPDTKMTPLELVSDLDMFPVFPKLELIQGGGAVRTYKMPAWTTKCQMLFKTNGRPLKAKAELLLGPIRTVHTLDMDMEDGAETPVQATLTFNKVAPVLRVTTSESLELPVLSGVYVPPPGRIHELQANTEKVWEMATSEQKQLVQGGSTAGGGGAIRYWKVPSNVETVQLIAWSKDVGGKSSKLNIEILQGPNNIKQTYLLMVGRAVQPYHAVFSTPGDGCVIRMTNKKYLEDGLVQIAVVPYEVIDEDASEGGFL